MTYEWRRIVFTPSGREVEPLRSHWYSDSASGETIARSLLNDEYPAPTSTGWRFVLQRRQVGEVETVE